MKLSKKSKLPKQVAPVRRTSISAAISNQHGVEASIAMFDLLRKFG